ncbi:MAG: hypothetical protein PHX27_04380 [Candidatus ainarchaeum sp.]|nr:hypothetical protein [Candidatus ainarchaeum sp.]
MVLSNNAQGAIEYLLIIGSAILVVAIVIIALVTLSSTSTENVDNSSGEIKNPLKELVANQQNQFYIPKGITKYYTYTGSETTIGTLESQWNNIEVCLGNNCDSQTPIEPNSTIIVTSSTNNSTIPKTDLIEKEKPKLTFIEKEILIDGELAFTPVRSDGSDISNNLNLAQAYANGEIIIYENNTEISVVQKPITKRGSFTSYSDWPGAVNVFDYIDIELSSCYSAYNSGLFPLSKSDFLFISNVTPGNEADQNTKYHVGEGYRFGYYDDYYDYSDECATCWNYDTGSCAEIIGLEVNNSYGDSFKVQDWVWDVFTYNLAYESDADSHSIIINPSTKTISGLSGNITVSYYAIQ